MVTMTELRALAKSYGLNVGRTTKTRLIEMIAQAKAQEFINRLLKGAKRGRFPAITKGDPENPQKRAQRQRDLKQLDDETNLSLRGKAIQPSVEQKLKYL